MKKNKEESWGESVRTLSVALLIAMVVRYGIYAPFTIPSGSMIPSLLVGDYIFVSKFAYGFSKYSLPFNLPFFEGRVLASQPNRGDVVVFYSHADGKDWIKRMIGLPGDRVQMVKGVLHINGEAVKMEKIEDFVAPDDFEVVDEKRGNVHNGKPLRAAHYLETLPGGVTHEIIKIKDFGEAPLDDTPQYTVPEGHYFVMGDNRDGSNDSRVMTERGLGFVKEEELMGRADFMFFSANGKSRWWEVWLWPFGVRFSRLFHLIP